MKVTPETITDDQIRDLHNGFIEGTATDAVRRHLCYVALAERCIGMPPGSPMKYRYPTPEERYEAKQCLAAYCNRVL